jgi:PKD repeat protein
MSGILVLTGFQSADPEEEPKATIGGELTFTVRTVSEGGNYAPKHVLAIWVEYSGDFVKTRKAMANQRKQYLYTWKAASNYNVVDAITGSTLNNHQTHTVTWDCTDLDGNIVADGDYDLVCEFTEKHAQGPLYQISFTKGPEGISLTPPDETYFKDIELEFVPVVSEFSADETEICQWGTVTFTDESVNASNWEWDFGEGAAPQTATSQGPHTVYYTTPGLKTVSLSVNGNVTESKTEFIDVTVTPIADFSFSANSLAVDFTNLSENGLTYLWEFGDGLTSTEINPSHTYDTAGTYDVTLHAYHEDCEDYETLPVSVPLVSTIEQEPFMEILVQPNPSSGTFTLQAAHTENIKKIGIFALSGQQMLETSVRVKGNSLITVDASALTKGLYLLRVETDQSNFIQKIIIR